MERKTVSVSRCGSYDPSEVDAALASALQRIGGLDWVRPGMRVGVKANLVSFLKPERAATTHPEVLAALTRMLIGRGASVVVGDSPGGIYNALYVGRVYAAAGMDRVRAAGAELNGDFREAQAEFPKAVSARHFTYTAWLDGVDAVINFCKLKTHGMMSMTAAVKNMFGVVPGTMKPEYHFRYPDERAFANMLVDLNEYFRPRLSIADAVVGMEGNGPTAGRPRPIGALMASEDPYALDLVCARTIGLGIDRVPTIRAAFERGLCPATAEELDVRGDAVTVDDFDNVIAHSSVRFSDGPFGGILEKLLRPRPQADAGCVGCAVCRGVCPAHAIEMVRGRPRIDRGRCIRCFCCQEFCPKGAMKVRRTAVARLLER